MPTPSLTAGEESAYATAVTDVETYVAVGAADEQHSGQGNRDRKSRVNLRIRKRAAGRKLCRLFYKYPISHFLISIDFAKYPWYNMGNGGKCHETD